MPKLVRQGTVVSLRNQKLYELRLQRRLSQRQVAEAVGITQSGYAMIERGCRHPRKETMKKLADFFGVTVDELFFQGGPPEKE